MKGFRFYGKLVKVVEKDPSPIDYCSLIDLGDSCTGFLHLVPEEQTKLDEQLVINFQFLATLHAVVGKYDFFNFTPSPWQWTISEIAQTKISLYARHGGVGLYFYFTLTYSSATPVLTLRDFLQLDIQQYSQLNFTLTAEQAQPRLNIVFDSKGYCLPEPPTNLHIGK